MKNTTFEKKRTKKKNLMKIKTENYAKIDQQDIKQKLVV